MSGLSARAGETIAWRVRRVLTPLFFTLAALLGNVGGAQAHVTELAILNVVETGEGRFRVLWELRPTTDRGEGLEPVFPSHCSRAGADLDCGPEGLAGPLSFEGIGQGQSAAMFKLRFRDGSTQVHTVTPSTPVVTIAPQFDATSWAGLAQIASAYVWLGVEHIMLGVDHLLFVLGLMWISRGGWMLFKTITAFTAAHTVTLAAATFGWVGVPETFVNAMIALSIAFIGLEILNARAGRSTVTLRNPWAVSFGFGLLHGFGFANGLAALGLPSEAAPFALLAFNVGVEIGQLGFVAAVLALGWAYHTMLVAWPRWSAPLLAYSIGGLGAFWFVERSVVLLGA